jgi:hypothetical protein
VKKSSSHFHDSFGQQKTSLDMKQETLSNSIRGFIPEFILAVQAASSPEVSKSQAYHRTFAVAAARDYINLIPSTLARAFLCNERDHWIMRVGMNEFAFGVIDGFALLEGSTARMVYQFCSAVLVVPHFVRIICPDAGTSGFNGAAMALRTEPAYRKMQAGVDRRLGTDYREVCTIKSTV